MNTLKINLIIAGANNPETLRLIEEINKVNERQINIIGWVDNDKNKIGTLIFGYKVLGDFDILKDVAYKKCYIFNNITRDAKTRNEATERLKQYKLKFISLIHPSINLDHVKIGNHIYIQEGSIIQANSVVSDHCVIFPLTLIGHDSFIGENTIIAAHVSVGGFCEIKQNVTIWMGAKIAPRLCIGKNSVIGMNATILSDVPENVTVATKPSVIIKKG